MRSPGAGRSGGLAGGALARFGAARLTGALRAGFVAFLRITGRLAGSFLRLAFAFTFTFNFAFAFFRTAIRSSRRTSPSDSTGYCAPFEPRCAR
jgi:hypothetical protein